MEVKKILNYIAVAILFGSSCLATGYHFGKPDYAFTIDQQQSVLEVYDNLGKKTELKLASKNSRGSWHKHSLEELSKK